MIDENQNFDFKGVRCWCGRSKSGFCSGLHEYSDEEWDDIMMKNLDEDQLSKDKQNES